MDVGISLLIILQVKSSTAYRSAVEVLCDTQDQSLILWDTLDLIPPFSCYLDGCLYSFCPSIHRQDHVEAKKFGNEFSKPREHIVVKRSRAER